MRKILIISAFLLSAILTSAAARRKVAVDDGYVVKVRGVMENFASVTKDFEKRLDTYTEAGVTHYFYCPSDDRYCNRWGWKIMYNDGERSAVRKMLALCRTKGVDFVWTINPSDGYQWTAEDYDYLLNKLILMYYNDIRHFALCLPQNEMMHEIVNLLRMEFAQRVREEVNIYLVNNIPVVNYPSEYEVAHTLMKGYHFDADFKDMALSSGAVICRLTLNDGFTGIPIAAAMDYARNPDEYQPDKSIVEGIDNMPDSVRDAFFTFLKHTGGEDESAGLSTFTLEQWTPESAASLYEEFDRIEKVPEYLKSIAGTSVIDALQPWLTEFGRLGTRGKGVIECIGYYKSNEVGRFWLSYVENSMTDEQKISYSCYPVGEEKLQPFCETAMKTMIDAFAESLNKGTAPRNLASTLYFAPNEALDSNLLTCVSSEGHIEFPIPAEANTCRLLTGHLPENRQVLFRQLGTDGSLVAEFVLKSPYTEFDLKEGAVKVDVLGDIDIYETIFVYL